MADYTFDPKEDYVVGVRKGNCQNNYNVEYTSKAKTFTYSGARLLGMNIDTWEDYLKQNPNQFKGDDTITLSVIKDGMKVYQSQGMPYPAAVKNEMAQANSLADNPAFLAYNTQKNVAAQQTRQIEQLNRANLQRIADLEAERTKMQDQILDMTRNEIKLSAELKATKKELETTNKQFEDFKGRFQEKFDKMDEAAGLSDMTTTILNNPLIQSLLGMGIQLGTGLAQKLMNGGQAPPQQLPQSPTNGQQQQYAQHQNNGYANYSTNEEEVFQQ